ncbi:SGNH/GDSL hydrolase family protein [uncultured Roseobacter sp.]|uniref:SGNH/GDSL hydrolase family protein n=1 Tax=uncultured Roseobacter sp. TaxID=114847 RepID=UPI0026164483|nr:SGNH/GDSL hydrolase family protein [uncultured Roseobacter sp.]
MPCIMCFGDSNTHGTRAMRFWGDRRRHPRGLRWPDIMAQALGADWDVIAEGHPGRTAVFADPIEGSHKNGQLALPVLLESHRPLDLVIVMLGTNDLKARFGASATDVALGIERLVAEISGSDAGPDGTAPAVLIAAPAQVQETGIFKEIFAGAREKSQALPAILALIAERTGAGFEDAGLAAEVDPVDGIHLSAEAHAAIGLAMATAVRRKLETERE